MILQSAVIQIICIFLYNWSNFRKICFVHSDGNCTDECIKEHLWYVRTDVHNLYGKEIKERAKEALAKLKKIGVFPLYEGNVTFGLQIVDGEKILLPYGIRLQMFAYHNQRFETAGEKYPEEIFKSD